MIERKYYPIDENTARRAQEANSFREYKEGSATEEYRAYVDKVYDVVDRIAEKRPHLLEKAAGKAERYSRKLAEYYNDYYRNEASCPSILISGGSNFPVREKEEQNSRRDTLMSTWNYLEDYARKISHMLTMEQPILAGDENAIELLEVKLDGLKKMQEKMKAVNKAIRMKDTEKGNTALMELGYSKSQIDDLRTPDYCGRLGYPSYALTNNNANIHRIEARIKSLKAAKEKGSSEQENELFKVVENTDIMRLQLIFAEKPDAPVRDALKKCGFRWSPKNGAWQRQLNESGRYALKNVKNLLGVNEE